MEAHQKNPFSGPVTVFQERRLPEQARPVGYAALIDAYELAVPIPVRLTAIGLHHRIKEADNWLLLTPRHEPEASLEGHLIFALKYEGLDLAVLKRLLLTVGDEPIEEIVQASPTGGYARRIWFLYEWLTRRRLSLPDAQNGSYVPVVDPKQQWATGGKTVSRYRVKDNLPGTPDFCPMVFKTKLITDFVDMDLKNQAEKAVAAVPKDIMARAAAFLLLKDSKSSYVIEGENAPQDRIQRWGRAIGEAGLRALDLDELNRLQNIVIGDQRFIRMGLRAEGGFVGTHDRDTQAPLPDHISARQDDLPSLIDGLVAFDRLAADLDPVIAASVLAFGFVYIHPFEDGNGRIHRYLIHHTLAQKGFSPPGVIFPISAAILDEIEQYRIVLESYSKRLLPVIDWRPTASNNVEVISDTADFYRFFDATPHAEFLFGCIQRTIEQDLPQETAYLKSHDIALTAIMNRVEMPDRMAEKLILFVRQSGGHLSKKRREREYEALTDTEVEDLENIIKDAFDDH
ncbi:Fic family protein [Paremcibacter congregatus]|uniref:Cell filamentation protein Fic n=1 Tax=Paremcibacter congregatus TaxID=2043170 RepID=A0A2G4YVZ0_9PROT|nr:Fic family protein [Paremcibacter congregatus]PHZ86512.1 cell filamentation protein Fic [Paremcibacter congregatus]QDE26315.1 Fic family protein [Paremcibacter congregatus]